MEDTSNCGVKAWGRLACELSGFGTGFPDALSGKLYFSWKCRGNYGSQESYRLKVCSREGEEYWDSGVVESRKSEAVPYEGKGLLFDRDYRAWVEVWGKGGERAEAFLDFSTGIGESEWKACWLKPYHPEAAAPMFRKEFRIDRKIIRGKLYLCGLGYQEAYMNGEKVNETVSIPQLSWGNNRCKWR